MARRAEASRIATAFLLAGGRGTRLRPVLADRPKPMAPVGGRPFVEWVLLSLQEQGIRRIVFCTGPMGDQIEAHFGDGRAWGMETVYSREEAALGTGGALRLAAEREPRGPLLALNADSYCAFDLGRLSAAHQDREARATLWLAASEDCGRYGSVEVGADGRVTAFREKAAAGRPGWVSAGIYLFERAVIEGLPPGRAVSLETDVLPALAGAGLYAVAGDGPLLDIGTPESYHKAESFLAAAGRR